MLLVHDAEYFPSAFGILCYLFLILQIPVFILSLTPEVIVGLLPTMLADERGAPEHGAASVGLAGLLQPAALLSFKHVVLLPQGLCTISLLSLNSFKPLLHFWLQVRPTLKIPFHTGICCPAYPLHRASRSLCSFSFFKSTYYLLTYDTIYLKDLLFICLFRLECKLHKGEEPLPILFMSRMLGTMPGIS